MGRSHIPLVLLVFHTLYPIWPYLQRRIDHLHLDMLEVLHHPTESNYIITIAIQYRSTRVGLENI